MSSTIKGVGEAVYYIMGILPMVKFLINLQTFQKSIIENVMVSIMPHPLIEANGMRLSFYYNDTVKSRHHMKLSC